MDRNSYPKIVGTMPRSTLTLPTKDKMEVSVLHGINVFDIVIVLRDSGALAYKPVQLH